MAWPARGLAQRQFHPCVEPAPAVSQARTTWQENSENRFIIVDKVAIQSASPLHGRPSSLRLYDNGSPSKGDRNMDKTPIVDLSTPTSSDSDCTVLKTGKSFFFC